MLLVSCAGFHYCCSSEVIKTKIVKYVHEVGIIFVSLLRALRSSVIEHLTGYGRLRVQIPQRGLRSVLCPTLAINDRMSGDAVVTKSMVLELFHI